MSPAHRLVQTQIKTRLAAKRLERGMTQLEMWEATGITRSSYLKLEKGGYRNPPVRHLTNCAIVLGCNLEDLIEPAWRHWKTFDGATSEPADPSTLWRP